jgi:hypothetical protein
MEKGGKEINVSKNKEKDEERAEDTKTFPVAFL